MKKYKIICFCIVVFILLLFIPPLIEGFDECIIDTLVNLKMDVAQIKEELKKNVPVPVENAELTDEQVVLANQSEETYNDLIDNMNNMDDITNNKDDLTDNKMI